MANKPNARNWNEVQLAFATVAMVLTLGLWNLFAGPDRVKAKQGDQVTAPPPTVNPPAVELTPTPLPQVKILLGGVAPQTQYTYSQPTTHRNRGGGGGGGGSGGGGGATGGGGGGGGGGGTGSS